MINSAKEPTILTLKVRIRGDEKLKFVDWQAKMNAVIASFPGFVSLEFSSSEEELNQWMIVQRFYNAERTAAWKTSSLYKVILDDLKKIIVEKSLEETSEEESSFRGGVTEVLITQVVPEKETAFREWSAKIHQVEAKFPGFRGVYLQSPRVSGGLNWITLLQFDTPENLDRWLNSSERKTVLKESHSLMSSLESHRVVSPYAGWFSTFAKKGTFPSVWKQAMLVLLVLFPIVMFELKYLSPLTISLNHAVGTFIGNAISVGLITFPFMPITIWFLRWWLEENSMGKKTILGTLIVILCYFLEICIFWNFF